MMARARDHFPARAEQDEHARRQLPRCISRCRTIYFHLTTAYDLLRYAGVEIGKRDFLGAVPGIAPA